MQKTNILETIERVLLYLLVVLVPLTILPGFINAYDTAKIAVLVFGVTFLVLIKSIKTIMGGGIKYSATSLDVPVVFIALSYLASAFLRTPDKSEAFFVPGVATAVVASAISFFLINQAKEKERDIIKFIVFGSSLVVSIVILMATSGVFRSMPVPAFIKEPSFNTAGGSLQGILYLVTLLPIGISLSLTERDTAKKVFLISGLAIVAFAFVILFFNTFITNKTAVNLPSLGTSWSIAIDTLKQSPLLGVGAGNYLTSFSSFRPLAYNETPLWNLRFTSANNYYLTMITETGILGFTSFALVMFALATTIKKTYKENKIVGWGVGNTWIYASVLILLIGFFITPANSTLLFLMFVLLSLAVSGKRVDLAAGNPADSSFSAKLPIIIVLAPPVLASLLICLNLTRSLQAEAMYKGALDAISRNDGKTAYDSLRQVISINPYVTRYRASYAQVNLALANAMAANENISDQDRAIIASLIQQAIREGKAAISINPQRANNWQLLGTIYRAVGPVAEGANDFAIQTIAQAIALDPINPELRITLGGMYYNLKRYNDAIDVLKLAVITKRDHPNAHYNLALAYREANQIDQAINEMTLVLSLVDKTSEDYALATKELEALQSKKKLTGTESSENLSGPSSEAPLDLESEIELPADSQPPTTSPSPSASPTPSPSALP